MQPSKNFFVRLSRSFRFAWRISPLTVFVHLVDGLLKSLFPYISIYCGALIIDALIAGKDAGSVMVIVYWMVALNFVVGLTLHFLKVSEDALDQRCLNRIQKLKVLKTSSFSYAQAEDEETRKMLQSAEDNANSSGGISSLLNDLSGLLNGVSNVVYSFVLLGGIFSSADHAPVDGFDNFLANPWSSLVLFGSLFLSVAIHLSLSGLASTFSFKISQKNVEGNRRFGYFYHLCSDYTRGKDIRLFHLQPLIMYAQRHDKFGVNETWNTFRKLSTAFQMLIRGLGVALGFVAYGYLGLKALYGYISIGQAVAYVGAVTLLSTGIDGLVTSLVDLGLISSYLQVYLIYINLKPAICYGNEKLDEKAPLSVEFSHVSFTYPHQKEKVLDDVSLTVAPGEKLAIVGVNGAGKTTMMKLLCRFYEPDSGEIKINGKLLSSYDEESCYRLSAIVFQDFTLFSYPIDENVAGAETVDEKKVEHCLEQAGILERIKNFPEGVKTTLYNSNEHNGVEISGGEAQKIAIARALYKDSPLIILDEPTAALDPKSEVEVYEKFGTLVQHKTAIFISHRMSSTKFCDHIAVISAGKLAEYGDHKSLLAIPNGIYHQMWNAQAQYYR